MRDIETQSSMSKKFSVTQVKPEKRRDFKKKKKRKKQMKEIYDFGRRGIWEYVYLYNTLSSYRGIQKLYWGTF